MTTCRINGINHPFLSDGRFPHLTHLYLPDAAIIPLIWALSSFSSRSCSTLKCIL